MMVQGVTMHKEKGMLVISIGPSAEDDENARLQKIAHEAGRVHKTPGRGPDLVLMDGMDFEDEAVSQFERYAKQKEYEAGFGHTKGLEELDQLRMMIPGETDGLEEKLYGKMSDAKRDMEDYEKFGGDVVSMELDRDHDCPSSNESDDDLLSWMALNGKSEHELSDIDHALHALREHIGDDAVAELAGIQDGKVILNVSTPRDDFMYAYDLRSGAGSILGVGNVT
jgi:hypothetical protein